MAKKKNIRIKQVKSTIGYNVRQKRTIEALGFHRVNQVIEKQDTPQIRGMVRKVSHLVKIVEEKK